MSSPRVVFARAGRTSTASAVGEHSSSGSFAVRSAPEVILAAIAGQDTERMLLGSRSRFSSTDDPVRVFQRFSTLDAVSNGRAEVILGRGSFTESYPLFGYDLSQYNAAVRGETGSRSSNSSTRSRSPGRAARRSGLDEPDGLSTSRAAGCDTLGRRRRRVPSRLSARRSTAFHSHSRSLAEARPVSCHRRVVPQVLLSQLGKPHGADWRSRKSAHVAVTSTEQATETSSGRTMRPVTNRNRAFAGATAVVACEVIRRRFRTRRRTGPGERSLCRRRSRKPLRRTMLSYRAESAWCVALRSHDTAFGRATRNAAVPE